MSGKRKIIQNILFLNNVSQDFIVHLFHFVRKHLPALRCCFLEMRHCRAGWVKVVVGRARAPQSAHCGESVGCCPAFQCSSSTAPCSHQAPPCSLQVTLVLTQLLQMPPMEEFPKQWGTGVVVRSNSWRSLAPKDNWRAFAFTLEWGIWELCSTGATSMCRKGSNILYLKEMKKYFFHALY